ncbi:MAG: ABC transporter substrate-binding protein [Eubacteriales bacterium]|nr:ABC transporter substrate-binding protein [Eubacteriales bacterium]MDD4324043.1 ABC transporter substrate-binding protein [Eubacteriales bacterium]MDD4541517.1 ABC transporter substrate-binding protein [Eubacteriales bacterium]
MKRKYLYIFVSLILVFSMFVGCSPADPDTSEPSNQTNPVSEPAENGDTFKVGAILPLSGANAHEGEVCQNAMEFAKDKINEAGGIAALGGMKLEIVYGDHQANAQTAITETERLIVNENVQALLGPYNSAVGYTTAPVAEKYKTPYLLNNSVADDILKQGYKWVFRANQTSSSNAVDQLSFLTELSDYGHEIKNIALVYENTEWGASAAEAIKDFAATDEYDFEVVLFESYPANTPDMTSLIIKLKNSGADVVIPESYLNDALLFMKTMEEMEVNIPVFAGGGGFTDPGFVSQAGDTAENMFILMAWSTDILEKKPEWATEFNDEFKEKYGYDFAELSSNSYQNVWVLADALERAGSTEPEEVRQAIEETDITDGYALINPYQGIKFGEVRGMTNQNIYAQMLVSQVQDGELRVVWPAELSPDDVDLRWND